MILLIMLFIQNTSFSYDTVQEKTFQLEKREVVDAKKVDFEKEETVAKAEDDSKERKPSSVEKRRQEAVHWKIQQIIDKRESQY
jgi:hypothetical protein